MKHFLVEYLDEDGRYHASMVSAEDCEQARLEAIKLDDRFEKTLTIKETE